VQIEVMPQIDADETMEYILEDVMEKEDVQMEEDEEKDIEQNENVKGLSHQEISFFLQAQKQLDIVDDDSGSAAEAVE